MTRLNFRLLRKSLWQSQDDCAQLLGVNKRTLQRWEGAQEPLPEPRMQQLETIEAALYAHCEAVVTGIVSLTKKHGQDRSMLTYYSNWHDLLEWGERPDWCKNLPLYELMVWEIINHCAAHQVEVTLVPFDPVAYHAWLEAREDSSPMRAHWSSYQG